MIIRILRHVDSATVLHQLRNCPHQRVFDGHMICRDQFVVYNTRMKKKRPQELCVMLHPSVVVLAKRRKEKSKRKKEQFWDFVEALDVRWSP